MDKHFYILFRNTGENISKHKGPLFQAISITDGKLTKEAAYETLLSFAEKDHNTFRDERTNSIDGIISPDQLWYEHDSRTYEFARVDQLDDRQKEAAKRDLSWEIELFRVSDLIFQ